MSLLLTFLSLGNTRKIYYKMTEGKRFLSKLDEYKNLFKTI